jgi:hypothetical protein
LNENFSLLNDTCHQSQCSPNDAHVSTCLSTQNPSQCTNHAHHTTVKSALTPDSPCRQLLPAVLVHVPPCLRASVAPSGSSFPTTSGVSNVSSGCRPAGAEFGRAATGVAPASGRTSAKNIIVLVQVMHILGEVFITVAHTAGSNYSCSTYCGK